MEVVYVKYVAQRAAYSFFMLRKLLKLLDVLGVRSGLYPRFFV